ncbi:MAG: hypothetical protein K1X94_02970 [Sandaracinaceae bacterium]|nr:hypothetical protein [Sandaracinaceae bacterium]
MPLPTFSALVPAYLARRAEVAADQVGVSIAVHPGLRAAHVRPGQFVKVAVPVRAGVALEGVFAMWNAPLEDTLEDGGHDEDGTPSGPVPTLRFLLRTNNPEGGEAADALATLPIGAPVLVSEPAGAGFDLRRAEGRDLAFVATATAPAPVRAAIEHARATGLTTRHRSLDLGVRSPAHVAYEAELERHRAAGLELHVHCSEPDRDGTVHGVLAHEALLSRLEARGTVRETFVIAVGQPAMVTSLREGYVALGGEAADVITNY